MDSLALAFGVAPPPRLDYYVTESVDQALETLGARFPRTFGAAGGFAKPVNWQVFSGIPSLGEEYRHEIAHVVLLPIIRGSSTSLLASEGVPTRLGGTAGRDYPTNHNHCQSRPSPGAITLPRRHDCRPSYVWPTVTACQPPAPSPSCRFVCKSACSPRRTVGPTSRRYGRSWIPCSVGSSRCM